MKKLSYILVLLVTLPMLLIVSCGDEKSNDKTPPSIENVRFNVNDTIEFKDDSDKDIVIEFNDSVKGNLDTDILVIGKQIRFRGYFADDKELSSAYFCIWGDSSQVDLATTKDTCLNVRKLMTIYMFGKLEMTIASTGTILIDPLPYKHRREAQTKYERKELDIRESKQRDDNDNYYFSISCSDVAGNENIKSYSEHPITLWHRETIIEKAKENPEAFNYKEKSQKPK